MMTSPSLFEALVFSAWYFKAHISIFKKTLNCSCTYNTGVVIGYNGRTIRKERIALAHADEMRPCPKLLALYLLCNHILNVSEALSTKKYGIALKFLSKAFGNASRPVSETEEAAADN